LDYYSSTPSIGLENLSISIKFKFENITILKNIVPSFGWPFGILIKRLACKNLKFAVKSADSLKFD
jgi:hypothetical protein